MDKLKYALRIVKFMVKLSLSLKYYSRSVDQNQTLEQVSPIVNGVPISEAPLPHIMQPIFTLYPDLYLTHFTAQLLQHRC